MFQCFYNDNGIDVTYRMNPCNEQQGSYPRNQTNATLPKTQTPRKPRPLTRATLHKTQSQSRPKTKNQGVPTPDRKCLSKVMYLGLAEVVAVLVRRP